MELQNKTSQGKRQKWWIKKTKTKYFTFDNQPITKVEDLERIKNLVIPPAWKYVRICPSKNGNIQAVGIDKLGKMQYIYHAKFTQKQKEQKFAKIEKFAKYLPNLRKTTNEHIQLKGFPKEKVLAIVIRLINSLYIRVGSEKSVKQYKTYGITTLKNRHLTIKNQKLIFDFVGKHHIKHKKILVDKDLAKNMQKLKEIGKKSRLFNYIQDEIIYPIKSKDINNYLKSLTSHEYSAKDFRTWGASLLCAIEFANIGIGENQTQIKKNIVKAVKKVASELGNTPKVCRDSYIHPKVINCYEQGKILTIKNKNISTIEEIEYEKRLLELLYS